MDIITGKSNIEISKVKVLRPVAVNSSTYFGISYKDNPLVIQTPYLYVKYKPIVFENGVYKLDLQLQEESMGILKMIETHIHTKIRKKYPHMTHTFTFSDNVLRTRSMDFNTVQFFDKKGSPLNGLKLCSGDKVCILVSVDKYIYTSHKSYINYQILQVQQYILNVKMIMESEYDCGGKYDVEKYNKMLKVGVPLIGVQQKMAMDGVDGSYINSFVQSKGRLQPQPNRIPPPPPPPPPPKIGGIAPKNKGMDMNAALNDIKNGNFTLKKMEQVKCFEKDITKSKILRMVDTSRTVPTLSEITDALKNLRRIN